MRIINNKYCFTDNIKKDIRIALLSDIHYSKKFNVDNLYNINKNLEEIKPDYICMPGDIIDGNYLLKDNPNNDSFLKWIESLGKITKVIISVGNHDINIDKDFNRYWNDEFFNKMRNIDNVYFLDNLSYEDDIVKFIGYTSIYDHNDILEDNNTYINHFNEIFNDLDNSKYNILMCHSPRVVLRDEIFTKLNVYKNINMVLSGHMHNGMYLPIMEKIDKSNRGIISPYKRLFPKIARGHVRKNYDNHSVDYIISGGVTKLSQSSSKFLMPFNILYPPHVEIIDIKRGE